jgi:hypothetical protein
MWDAHAIIYFTRDVNQTSKKMRVRHACRHVFIKYISNSIKMLIELSIYNKARWQLLVRFDQIV